MHGRALALTVSYQGSNRVNYLATKDAKFIGSERSDSWILDLRLPDTAR
jgi:hypothetical protein